MKKTRFHNLSIVIETPKGEVRKGLGFQHKLPADYGYIEGFIGADLAEVDCYVGPYLQSKIVFVVNQNRINSAEFDEHKVLLGYNFIAQAKKIYYEGHTHSFRIFRSIKTLTMEQFKQWLKFGDMSKPINE